jgi:hypothetical protein
MRSEAEHIQPEGLTGLKAPATEAAGDSERSGAERFRGKMKRGEAQTSAAQGLSARRTDRTGRGETPRYAAEIYYSAYEGKYSQL